MREGYDPLRLSSHVACEEREVLANRRNYLPAKSFVDGCADSASGRRCHVGLFGRTLVANLLHEVRGKLRGAVKE